MTRPTLTSCQDQLTAFAAREQPEDWVMSVNPMRVREATLTVLSVFWEGRDSGAVPREARLVFGLDQRLLWAQALCPGTFLHATEEGYGIEDADRLATRKLATFEGVFAYLRGEAYQLADSH